ncbi:hypothetical protein NQZ68_010840 [Dissostichus eleginoides]|nr:hypothetical protein NQZ68_010840 [Dissostichus eleginoides]
MFAGDNYNWPCLLDLLSPGAVPFTAGEQRGHRGQRGAGTLGADNGNVHLEGYIYIQEEYEGEESRSRALVKLGNIMSVSRLVLLLGVLLCVGAQLSSAQHWSHGWYPGGKRELDSFSTSEISEEIKLCEAGECSYLRPQRRSILRNIILDALARELQKRK